MIDASDVKFGIKIGLDLPQMGQVWDFLRDQSQYIFTTWFLARPMNIMAKSPNYSEFQ